MRRFAARVESDLGIQRRACVSFVARIDSPDGKPSHRFSSLSTKRFVKKISRSSLCDLLRAFRQDQTPALQSWTRMIGYCVYSRIPWVAWSFIFAATAMSCVKSSPSYLHCAAARKFLGRMFRGISKSRIYIPVDLAPQHAVTENEIVTRPVQRPLHFP